MADPWGEAVAAFLADLLDSNVKVAVHTDAPPTPAAGSRRVATSPQVGSDGRTRQFSVTDARGERPGPPGGLAPELGDLPAAALRALARVTHAASTADLGYPSIARALHDVIIAEVVADRLKRQSHGPIDLDLLVRTIAGTIDYLAELAATRLEGTPVTHGVVIIGDPLGQETIAPAVAYPGRLPTRKRTPLLFDGTHSALVVNSQGNIVRGVERSSLPASGPEPTSLEVFDELPGLEGALTAAASAAFHGIGFYLRADHSTWIFDDGALLFVRRGVRWKSIAFESFTRTLTELGSTSPDIGERLARTALRLSMQGHGAILAIVEDPSVLDSITRPKDLGPGAGRRPADDVDADLAHLLRLNNISTPGGLARLARLDGATAIDTHGNVVAYGAIVRNSESTGEGARTAAARTLSTVANVTLSVSHDGPITVFHQGYPVLEIL